MDTEGLCQVCIQTFWNISGNPSYAQTYTHHYRCGSFLKAAQRGFLYSQWLGPGVKTELYFDQEVDDEMWAPNGSIILLTCVEDDTLIFRLILAPYSSERVEGDIYRRIGILEGLGNQSENLRPCAREPPVSALEVRVVKVV